MDKDSFLEVCAIARRDYGMNITDSKLPLISARLRKRMSKLKIASYKQYISLIQSDQTAKEVDEFISCLTTNVTGFFREPHHFKIVEEEFSNRLIDKAKSGGKVRLWSAGCSKGSETYSIAITISEIFPDYANYDVKILATDLDPEILSFAEKGLYEKADITGLNDQHRSKYFDQVGDRYQIKSHLQRTITFGRLNLLDRFPMTGSFDVIFCRNVVIYFDKETQKLVWKGIFNHLAKESLLILGHSERLSSEFSRDLEIVGVTAYRSTT